ncbi:MAG TPA: hypothetical protein PK082_02275, partial [Phycisphaerae bacterium]|nr:hypothetical protein [Phycisphaerae bacterium]
GDRVKIRQLEELIVKTKEDLIKETGMGIPPEKYLKGVEGGALTVLAVAQQAPPWMNQKLRATGNAAIDTENANAAQAKLMAFRGAELDARRKLAEQINGLMITSNTSVNDFVTQNDEIRTAMLAFQQGAQVIDSSKKMLEDGTVQIDVEIELRPLWNMVMHYTRSLNITLR